MIFGENLKFCLFSSKIRKIKFFVTLTSLNVIVTLNEELMVLFGINGKKRLSSSTKIIRIGGFTSKIQGGVESLLDDPIPNLVHALTPQLIQLTLAPFSRAQYLPQFTLIVFSSICDYLRVINPLHEENSCNASCVQNFRRKQLQVI